MHLEDTIVAVGAWGVEPAGRALIRLSGPGAFDALQRIVEPPPAPERRVSRARVKVGTASIPSILAAFPAPASYTGEDVIELHVVANRTLVRALESALTAGERVRLAGPGEFTARAFLNGRLDAEQAEGVGALIAARSEAELAEARALLDGRTGAEYRQWMDELVHLLALVESGIDFTDQDDVVPIPPRELGNRLCSIAARIKARLGPGEIREVDTTRIRAVLVGPPNAGKSTLFNALLGRERAVVSDIAGTTRDALIERLPSAPGGAMHSVDIDLIDLAGLDSVLEARSPLDEAAQAQAKAHVARAGVIVHCDPAGRFEPAIAPPRGARVIRVRTKADLPGAGEGAGDLAVCALDGWRIEALRRAIVDAAEAHSARNGSHAVVSRHARALRLSLGHLRSAIERVEGDVAQRGLRDPALVAIELRSAAHGLGEIAGRISPDDVLGRIFATFCIGK